MQKSLIVIGIGLVVAGLLWPILSKTGLGRLPGDIIVRRGGFVFYFPITTMILLSVIVTALFRFLGRN